MDIAKKGSAYSKQCVLYISLRHGATEASLRAILIRNQETASQRSPALDNVPQLKQHLHRSSHWKPLRAMIRTSDGQSYISQPPIEEFADPLETLLLYLSLDLFRWKCMSATSTPGLLGATLDNW